MTWYPIAFLPPQLENASGAPYSGAVLKAYAAGTSTPISMATDATGATLTSSSVLNSMGYTTYLGTVIIPHLSQNYKLSLYPDQTSANANSGAVWTIDDVQIAEATNEVFLDYFDGDGTTSSFTLSEDFGTSEELLMVFSDKPLTNYITNGDFATDTIWVKGSGWTIGSGVATATGAINTNILQEAAEPIIAGQSYTFQFTVTASAGTLTPSAGGVAGTTRGSGTWRETIIAGSSHQQLVFTGVGFTGTLDTVSVKQTTTSTREILTTDEYTIVSNTLTLDFAPPSGTKNVIVFAPSKLLGAASNAAAAAATSETNAAASAASASASYDSFDDRYLGSKTSDPTLDNDGNALMTGALYWNSVSAVMKVYNGVSWVVTFNPSPGDIPYFVANATSPAYLDFHEDTDNGTNKVTLIAPASLAADATVTLPGSTSTLATLALAESLSNKTLVGVTDASNAGSGNVGELVSSVLLVGSAVTLTTVTAANITSISLPAGDWEVTGLVAFETAATTSITQLIASISPTSATLASLGVVTESYAAQVTGATVPGVATPVISLAPCRISISSTQTIYLVGRGTFTVSTLKGYGWIKARRVR